MRMSPTWVWSRLESLTPVRPAGTCGRREPNGPQKAF